MSSNQCCSFFSFIKICCSGIHAPCGPKSSWVPAPIMQWGPTTVQLFAGLCPSTDEVAALRYAWRDWPCDFKACPIYSASGILPAPPFIISRHQAKGNIWISYWTRNCKKRKWHVPFCFFSNSTGQWKWWCADYKMTLAVDCCHIERKLNLAYLSV